MRALQSVSERRIEVLERKVAVLMREKDPGLPCRAVHGGRECNNGTITTVTMEGGFYNRSDCPTCEGTGRVYPALCQEDEPGVFNPAEEDIQTLPEAAVNNPDFGTANVAEDMPALQPVAYTAPAETPFQETTRRYYGAWRPARDAVRLDELRPEELRNPEPMVVDTELRATLDRAAERIRNLTGGVADDFMRARTDRITELMTPEE